MKQFSLFVFTLLLAAPVYAKTYVIDYDQSQVGFSGTHAGKEFSGAFSEWSAEIFFNEQELASSTLSARFGAASAQTGDKMYDGTLPQADWFDAKNHPEIIFISDSIVSNEDGSFSASGNLTIKEITNPVTFNFSLENLDDGHTKALASFEVDRLAFDIGKKSDAKAEWVGQMISIDLEIIAASQGE